MNEHNTEVRFMHSFGKENRGNNLFSFFILNTHPPHSPVGVKHESRWGEHADNGLWESKMQMSVIKRVPSHPEVFPIDNSRTI